jgi:hypothetical protein
VIFGFAHGPGEAHVCAGAAGLVLLPATPGAPATGFAQRPLRWAGGVGGGGAADLTAGRRPRPAPNTSITVQQRGSA